MRAPVLSVVLVGLLLGCVSTPRHRDWSGYTGPGAEAFHREEIEFPEPQKDPFEPFNRTMALLNDELITKLLDPVARAYRRFVPSLVRTGIDHATTNLLFPRHFVNNLLQGKPRGAYDETRRFVVNSTLGLAGVFDPATGLGIPASPEDTGQTLGVWGWKRSRFLVLPVFGPGNVRDAVGLAGDTLIAPENLFLPRGTSSMVAGIRLLNDEADRVDSYARLLRREYDAYALTRQLYGIKRRRLVKDYGSRPTAAVETLQAVYLSFQDPGFPSRSEVRETAIAGGDRRVRYDLWMQPGEAPLVVVLPGLATHRESDSSLGLAEMAFRAGFSVATVSDALNWEFVRYSSTSPAPGYPATDARDVAAALEAVVADVEERHPDRVGRRALLGVSLGAFHALLVAADGSEVFDRFVAVNPPVRLLHGMRRIDAYYNAPLEWGTEERKRRIEETLMKALAVGSQGLQPSRPLPFTDREARFLIGLNFRMGLRDLIFETQRANDAGVLQTPLRRLWRDPAYREITRYSYVEYLHAFVLPWVLANDAGVSSAEELDRRASLSFRESELRAVRQRLRVFTNRNDFLLDEGDVGWLRAVVGAERFHVFEKGGHLGNLHEPDVQARLVDALADLLTADPAR